MKSKTLTFAIGGLVFLSLAVIALVQNFGIGGWSFTKSEKRYDGRFFRMVVRLDYHGEPQVFDFVVGCNVHSIVYKDSSSSRDVGLIPAVYGRRMKDGKGIVIRPPDVCNGETTAGGEVPPAFMPLIIVYDNADTLDQGLAYLSDDAYDSSLSDMKFGSTEIIASTRAEFDADGEKGPPNLVTRERYWGSQSVDVAEAQGVKPKLPRRTPNCTYASRYRLPETMRETVRRLWPSDRPKYWLAQTFDDEQRIHERLFVKEGSADRLIGSDYTSARFDINQFKRFTTNSLELGLPRRIKLATIGAGGFSGNSEEVGPITSYYPVTSRFAERHWPQNSSDWPAFVQSLNEPIFKQVELRGGDLRGLAACWDIVQIPNRVVPFDPIDEQTWSSFVRLRGYIAVDGSKVALPREENMGFNTLRRQIFENDEFLIEIYNFNLDTMNGDVR